MGSKTFATVFEPFIEATLASFSYLTSEFGFEHYKTEVVSYECSVRFRKNDRVAVHITCEAGALPWVMLVGRQGKSVREAALDFVIEHRCPDKMPDVHYEFPAAEKQVVALVQSYATLLRECAEDFLEGDPAVVIGVQPAVDADFKEKTRDFPPGRRPKR